MKLSSFHSFYALFNCVLQWTESIVKIVSITESVNFSKKVHSMKDFGNFAIELFSKTLPRSDCGAVDCCFWLQWSAVWIPSLAIQTLFFYQLPMFGFELRTSGIGSGLSVICVTNIFGNTEMITFSCSWKIWMALLKTKSYLRSIFVLAYIRFRQFQMVPFD